MNARTVLRCFVENEILQDVNLRGGYSARVQSLEHLERVAYAGWNGDNNHKCCLFQILDPFIQPANPIGGGEAAGNVANVCCSDLAAAAIRSCEL
jgi:hypothetical protein